MGLQWADTGATHCLPVCAEGTLSMNRFTQEKLIHIPHRKFMGQDGLDDSLEEEMSKEEKANSQSCQYICFI